MLLVCVYFPVLEIKRLFCVDWCVMEVSWKQTWRVSRAEQSGSAGALQSRFCGASCGNTKTDLEWKRFAAEGASRALCGTEVEAEWKLLAMMCQLQVSGPTVVSFHLTSIGSVWRWHRGFDDAPISGCVFTLWEALKSELMSLSILMYLALKATRVIQCEVPLL